jgi:hypothetical protein
MTSQVCSRWVSEGLYSVFDEEVLNMDAPSFSETSITTDSYSAISREICMREDFRPKTK